MPGRPRESVHDGYTSPTTTYVPNLDFSYSLVCGREMPYARIPQLMKSRSGSAIPMDSTVLVTRVFGGGVAVDGISRKSGAVGSPSSFGTRRCNRSADERMGPRS